MNDGKFYVILTFVATLSFVLCNSFGKSAASLSHTFSIEILSISKHFDHIQKLGVMPKSIERHLN